MSEKNNLAIKINSINSILLLYFHQNKNSLSVQKKIKLDIPWPIRVEKIFTFKFQQKWNKWSIEFVGDDKS